jgi:penicillin-binding protein 1A
MYLNQVYFGQGAYGVEAASRTYFGKSVSEVTARGGGPARGITPRAVHLCPVRKPEGAKQRREIVLRKMVEYGSLKDGDARSSPSRISV